MVGFAVQTRPGPAGPTLTGVGVGPGWRRLTSAVLSDSVIEAISPRVAPERTLQRSMQELGSTCGKRPVLGRLMLDVKRLTLQPQIVTMSKLVVDLSPAQGSSDDELI
jgi:hypothetical protein